jgi:hypothetical protein
MNDDESTYEVPDYILSRLQPTLALGYPNRQDELAILQYHLPYAASDLVQLTVDFLQKAHSLRLDFSPRDGINQLRYALKLLQQDTDHPISKDTAWRESLERCLGPDALDLDALADRKKNTLGGDAVPLGLGDFFFSPNDPLNPDRDDKDDEVNFFGMDDDDDDIDFQADGLDDEDIPF